MRPPALDRTPGCQAIMSECSLMTNGDLLRHVTQRAKLFVDFFLNNKYGDTPLEEALLVYAEFHILEGQPVEWSNTSTIHDAWRQRTC